jgi:hypothetical protein
MTLRDHRPVCSIVSTMTPTSQDAVLSNHGLFWKHSLIKQKSMSSLVVYGTSTCSGHDPEKGPRCTAPSSSSRRNTTEKSGIDTENGRETDITPFLLNGAPRSFHAFSSPSTALLPDLTAMSGVGHPRKGQAESVRVLACPTLQSKRKNSLDRYSDDGRPLVTLSGPSALELRLRSAHLLPVPVKLHPSRLPQRRAPRAPEKNAGGNHQPYFP